MAADPAITALDDRDPRLAGLVDVLARAFEDNPGYTNLLPDVRMRRAALPVIFRAFGGLHAETGDTDVLCEGGEVRAGAIWAPPGRDVGLATLVRIGLPRLAWRIGLRATRRLVGINGELDALRDRHCPGPHWCLLDVAVEPGAQGRGLGGALVRHGLRTRADAGGLPSYLYTSVPAHVGYYERFGFELLCEERMGGPQGYVTHLMRRPARTRLQEP